MNKEDWMFVTNLRLSAISEEEGRLSNRRRGLELTCVILAILLGMSFSFGNDIDVSIPPLGLSIPSSFAGIALPMFLAIVYLMYLMAGLSLNSITNSLLDEHEALYLFQKNGVPTEPSQKYRDWEVGILRVLAPNAFRISFATAYRDHGLFWTQRILNWTSALAFNVGVLVLLRIAPNLVEFNLSVPISYIVPFSFYVPAVFLFLAIIDVLNKK